MWHGNRSLPFLMGLALITGGACGHLCGCGESDKPPRDGGAGARARDGGTSAKDGNGREIPTGEPETPAPAVTTYRDVVKLSQRRDPKYLPRLKDAAADEDWKKRHAGVTGIGQLKDKGDPKFLLSVLGNTAERVEIRAAAAEALGAMRYYEAGTLLIQAMESDSVRLRTAAGVAIRNIMRIRYGYSATGALSERNKALALLRANWPKFYEYMRSKEQR